jgi:hypothetical protein
MDQKLAKGFVRSDERVITETVHGKIAQIGNVMGDVIRPKFTSRKQLSSPELKALIIQIDGIIENSKPTVRINIYRPPTRIHKRAEAYERLFILPFACMYQGSEEFAGFDLVGIRVFANCKTAKVNVTFSPISLTGHALERALERKGVDVGQIYDPECSPTHQVAEATFKAAGLVSLWLKTAQAMDKILSIQIPVLDGIILGHNTKYGLEDNFNILMTKGIGTSGYSENAVPQFMCSTFVHDSQLRPEQTEMKQQLLDFNERHKLTLDALGEGLVFRDTELGAHTTVDEAEKVWSEFIKLLGKDKQ